MDNGWAVVIGATIALIGSAVVPWIREQLTARERLRRERRTALADAIRDLIAVSGACLEEGMNALKFAAEVEPVRARLSLLLDSSESEIDEFTMSAIRAMMRHEDDRIAAIGFVHLSRSLPRWLRGELSPKEAQALLIDAIREEEEAASRDGGV